MKKKDFLIIVAGLVVLFGIILVVILTSEKPLESGKVNIITEKAEYKTGESLRIKIENNLSKNICFSSCYPYYWEKKDSMGWNDYHYVDCTDSNLAKYCVDPKSVKAFELNVPSIKSGTHRLAVSACIGCEFQVLFNENQRFYSNDFIIK